jgi:hypothetical protein
MTWTRIGITLTGTAAVLSVLIAGSTVWLLLTDPATIAGAIDQGTVTPLARQLAAVLVTAVRGLLAYL